MTGSYFYMTRFMKLIKQNQILHSMTFNIIWSNIIWVIWNQWSVRFWNTHQLVTGVEVCFPLLVKGCFLQCCPCVGTESLDYLWDVETGLFISSGSVDAGQKSVRKINDCDCAVTIGLFFILKYARALLHAMNTRQALKRK